MHSQKGVSSLIKARLGSRFFCFTVSSELETLTFHAGTLRKLVVEPRIQICRIHYQDSASVSCTRCHCNNWHHRGSLYRYDLVDYLQDIVQYMYTYITNQRCLSTKRIQQKLPTTPHKLCCTKILFNVVFSPVGQNWNQHCTAKASKCDMSFWQSFFIRKKLQTPNIWNCVIHNSLIHVVVSHHVLTYYAHVEKKPFFQHRVSMQWNLPDLLLLSLYWELLSRVYWSVGHAGGGILGGGGKTPCRLVRRSFNDWKKSMVIYNCYLRYLLFAFICYG